MSVIWCLIFFWIDNQITPMVLVFQIHMVSIEYEPSIQWKDVVFWSTSTSVCRSYDYTSDANKLKLFPSTLMGVVIWWFMVLTRTMWRMFSSTMGKMFSSTYTRTIVDHKTRRKRTSRWLKRRMKSCTIFWAFLVQYAEV